MTPSDGERRVEVILVYRASSLQKEHAYEWIESRLPGISELDGGAPLKWSLA